MTHSPGPFVIHRSTPSSDDARIMTQDGQHIGYVNIQHTLASRLRSLENAALFAVAPDMEEGLRRVNRVASEIRLWFGTPEAQTSEILEKLLPRILTSLHFILADSAYPLSKMDRYCQQLVKEDRVLTPREEQESPLDPEGET